MSFDSLQYISTAELAKFLGISRVAVLKRIQKGKITAIKIGRSYAIPKSTLQDQFPDFKRALLPLQDGKEYVSVMEAAQMLGLTRFAVAKRIQKKQLEAKKVGRHYVIDKSHIKALQDEKVFYPEVEKEFFSIPECANVLGISRVAVFKRVKKGTLKAKWVGRHYAISRNELAGLSVVVPKQEITPKEYYSIPELAKHLGISRIAVFKQIKRGKINAIKIGRSYAIHKAELRPFLIKGNE